MSAKESDGRNRGDRETSGRGLGNRRTPIGFVGKVEFGDLDADSSELDSEPH